MSENKKNSDLATIGLAILIVAMIFGSRLLMVDFPNFKPVTALLLLSGMLFSNWRLRLVVPLVGTIMADVVLGIGEMPLMFCVYASLGVNSILGARLRKSWRSQPRLANRLAWSVGAISLANLQFFAITNFAVWACTPWYDKSFGGLFHCMASAVPFWKYSMAGDVIFGLIPLCGLALVEAWSAASTKGITNTDNPATARVRR